MTESYFAKYRRNIIGIDQIYQTPFGLKKIVYADWVASGRLYGPIEKFMSDIVGPFVANTHSESSTTGAAMTRLYHQARAVIRRHVNASDDDILITSGSGMTSLINKFQRILQMRLPEKYAEQIEKNGEEKPLVLITHMEHHSNQTSWLSCHCDVVIVNRGSNGLPDLNHLENLLQANAHRKLKIGSFTAASNVTGIQIPLHEMAVMIHKYGGYFFGDFAAAAPYVKIDMHPSDPAQRLDAIFFSPHKFLGGPGSSGVLVFNKALYANKIPDKPGGGTVDWTNPWGEHRFIDDIEAREDGGTPGFLQTVRAALAILLKEEMGYENIHQREEELKNLALYELRKNPKIQILDPVEDRLGIVSFYVVDLHYNLMVKLLCDRYGVQVRGGCSCAGTYGHILLDVDHEKSKSITSKIDQGDLTDKPGWVRISFHPTMTNDELIYVTNSIRETVENAHEWQKDYTFDPATAEFTHKTAQIPSPVEIDTIRFVP